MGATSLLSKYTSYLGVFSGDVIFLLSVAFLFFAFTGYFGRGKMVSFILAMYPATLLYNTFPFMEKLIILEGDKLVLLNKLGIFLIFLIPLCIIINRYIFSASEYSGYNNMLRNAGLGLVGIILLMVFSYGTLSLDLLHDFGGNIDSVFDSETKLFYWNLASILLLVFL